MGESTLVDVFSSLKPREYVVLDGYPDAEQSKWHVNKSVSIGGGDSERRAFILQKADASEHWVTLILSGSDSDWEIEQMRAFTGADKPALTNDNAGTKLDPDSISAHPVSD